MRALLLFLVVLVPQLSARAQQNNIPLQRDIYMNVERNAANKEARIHSGLKPLLASRADTTDVMGYRVDNGRYYYWLTEKIFKEHLLIVKDKDFHLNVDPVFNLEIGQDRGDRTAYADTNHYIVNSRGVMIAGDFGKKFSFQTVFYETQAVVPQYLLRYSYDTGVIAGQARTKYKGDNTTLDYAWSQGTVSYSPTTWLNIQLGNGKHFVGHGYRSMLLSDNAIVTPYLQFSLLSKNKRWQYTTWHTKMMHGVTKYDRLPTGESSESLFYWMRARFNHLSYDLGRVQLGLFEATMFRNISSGGVQPFNAMELNPVIGLNTAVFGFNAANKTLVGLDARIKITNKAYAYGQFATDGPSRYGWQAGFRAFDVLRKDLHFQLEYNAATPFMYMSAPVRQAYMHAGQPLAHPRGNSFSEVVGIVDAGFKRLWFQCKVNVSVFQKDTSDTYNDGNVLNKPDVAVPSPNGPLTRNLFNMDVNASYLLNPNTNLRFVFGCMRRDLSNATDAAQTTYYYLAFRTNLFNRYYDL